MKDDPDQRIPWYKAPLFTSIIAPFVIGITLIILVIILIRVLR